MSLTRASAAVIKTEELVNNRNKIINGAMEIDQRNAGSNISVTSTTTYSVDRWLVENTVGSGKLGAIQSTDVPTGQGFKNSIQITVETANNSTSGVCNIRQGLEGINLADFCYGSSAAKTVSVSFWVKSSVTGTYCVALRNVDSAYSSVIEYTINSANTWEKKTIPFSGDTSNAITLETGLNIILYFDLGSGTSFDAGSTNTWLSGNLRRTTNQTKFINNLNAIWYITGVQLEVGSVATPFERRPFGTELALCQRYFEKSFNLNVALANGTDSTSFVDSNALFCLIGTNRNATGQSLYFKVQKRVAPTITKYGNSSGFWRSLVPNQTEFNFNTNLNPSQISDSKFALNQQVVDGTLILVQGHFAADSEL